MDNHIEVAKKVINIESKQILNLSKLLDENFEKSIEYILNCKGKVIISGMGKSGIVGKKIAATLASTGTPSFFLHPGEAYHGDLGMIEKKDIVILISNSGETDEILKLIPFLRHQKNITISLTRNPTSTLAINTNFHINIFVEKEACPLQLAPTSSTTATMVIGDAIAVTLMKARKFKEENFAKYHPGGSLGKKLLYKVSDVMHNENLPLINGNESIIEITNIISKGKFGIAIVVEKSVVVGIITDGDIRRAMENNQKMFFNLIGFDIMNSKPKTISPNEKLNQAGNLFNDYKVNTLLVTDAKNHILGVIQTFDL